MCFFVWHLYKKRTKSAILEYCTPTSNTRTVLYLPVLWIVESRLTTQLQVQFYSTVPGTVNENDSWFNTTNES
jgi:hypothetical protein